MAIMIKRGKELIRINPNDDKKLEYSTDSGCNWHTRNSGSSVVVSFRDLMDYGDEILATTDSGLFYSKDGGCNWHTCNSGTSVVGSFRDLMDYGDEILATTDNGLFYSKDGGCNWHKRS
jgi:photosystem II stability/assembly factor-like uncharacterized protein